MLVTMHFTLFLTTVGKDYTVAFRKKREDTLIINISLTFGWVALVGALLGFSARALPLFELFGRYQQAQVHGKEATRSEVSAVFQLQGILNGLRENDTYQPNGTMRANWMHRTWVVFCYFALPVLLGAGIGVAIDSILATW